MGWIKIEHGFNGLFYFVACVYLVTDACWLMVDCTRRLVVVDEAASDVTPIDET